ncbi:MAG TPA: GNAT family N-acetyltransferase [Lachnospiraceae bacterium]|nr:GNAT family N-acetyltransferase [Lachnospiraceae bacterium]
MLKAVIFDMDGVLVDSEPLNLRALVIAMKEFGVTLTTEYCTKFIGKSNTETMTTIIDDYNLNESTENLIKANLSTKRRLIQEEGYEAIPYVKELIQDLYKAGIKLAIASSSPETDIISVTRMLGIQKYFNKLISGDHVQHSKPAPDIFLLALKELGVNADQALVIEDSMNGTIAAYEANIKSIGYINPNSGNQDLSRASVLIESFQDIDYQFLENELLRSHNLPVTIATTKRLKIRELTVDDIKAMYTIYQDPKVREYIDNIEDYLDAEIEKHKAYIKNIYSFFGYGLWGVFNLHTDQLIGRCGIQNRMIDGKVEIELGYLLDVNHWGMGYALECTKAVLDYAFEYLGIKRVVASIDKFNHRSIKVATKLGMTYEKDVNDNKRSCSLYVITYDQYMNNVTVDHQDTTQNATHMNDDDSKRRGDTVIQAKQVLDKTKYTDVYSKRYSYKKDIN